MESNAKIVYLFDNFGASSLLRSTSSCNRRKDRCLNMSFSRGVFDETKMLDMVRGIKEAHIA